MAVKRNRPSETDLKSLKALFHALLELDIQPTKMSPLVVKHPFTDSGIVGLRKEDGSIAIADLTSGPASLHLWREQTGRLIDDAENPIDLFMMITKPYKLGFLKYAAPYLSEQDTMLRKPTFPSSQGKSLKPPSGWQQTESCLLWMSR